MKLPVDYTALSRAERREVRGEYIRVQGNRCQHCGNLLSGPPTTRVSQAYIDRRRFPKGFFRWPIHLHHDRGTGMTIGAVHARCNAWLWQYRGE